MRISADRYQKMIATGVLGKYDRVELIEGDILEMPPIGWLHSAVTARLNKLLVPTANGYAHALELTGNDTASPRALPSVQIPVGTLFS